MLSAGRLDIGGHRVRVSDDYKKHCVTALDDLVAHL
jgi:hypothetical protein